MKYQGAVQRTKSQYVEVTFADLPTGVFTPFMTLPAGAIDVASALHVIVASNAATSETLSVGTSGAATSVISAANSKTAARTAGTLANGPRSGKTVLGFTRTETGAASAGTYGFLITYAVAGSSESTQD